MRPAGRVDGRHASRATGTEERYSADIVVVACGALSSALLLLRSANDKHPERPRQRLRPGRAATTCATTSRS